MKKILLIEDETILLEMYKDKLEDAGFEAIGASEAKEGLKIAKKEKPDLIILDILLPKENGIYFLQQLKEDSEIASIPVIAFSNYDDPLDKKRALRLGAREYLLKTNYTPQGIIEKIKEYLE